MTAAGLPTRPTVEAVTAAHASYSWAYRGDVTMAAAYLTDLDETGLCAVMMAASITYHQAEVLLVQVRRLAEGLSRSDTQRAANANTGMIGRVVLPAGVDGFAVHGTARAGVS